MIASTRRRTRVALALLVVLLLVATAYLVGRAIPAIAHPSTAADAPATFPPPAPPQGTQGPPAPDGGQPDRASVDDPRAVAASWFRAVRSLAWTDQRPDSWSDRARPFVTATLDATYRHPDATGPGVEWRTFVERRCTSRVLDANAVVPDEAPSTPTSVYIQVTGTVTTTCTAGQPPGPATEPAAATVETRRLPDGTWRVDHRIY